MSDADSAPIPSPRENPRLLGHQAAERALRDAWASGRLPHAWLITGPRGIGKATLAYRFARFLLAGEDSGGGLFGPAEAPPSGLDLDPEHPTFRRVAAGGHSDLRSVERTVNDKGKLRTEIVVDQIREVGGFLRLTPAEGDWRVVVVDSADEMNPNAANAILKILEEPPARAVLLLVCHAPGRLLPTVRSRCRRLALQPLAATQVAALLQDFQPELSADGAAALAALAAGSPGHALALAAHGGLDLLDRLEALVGALPGVDHDDARGFADAAAGSDPAWRTAGELLDGLLCDMARLAAGAPPEVPGRADWAGPVAGRAPAGEWVAQGAAARRLWRLADAVNLDRRQVALDVLTGLRTLCEDGRRQLAS